MIVVLVHGWSVRHTDTYGELPARLEREARAGRLPELDVRNIWLGKYVSFRDEVRLEDLSRAFEAALREELGAVLAKGRRFACITHSTGGPVVRDWWQRHYAAQGRPCPMSHLVMLAPANFGSALAQLGKGRLSRIKTWFQGVEPGQGVLDWLELGSPESWDLNVSWVRGGSDPSRIDPPVFPCVLTGQVIDRKLYDNLNSYTGENGSDGVVRVAAANLNATYLRLEQTAPRAGEESEPETLRLNLVEHAIASPTAFALVPGRSHSGEDLGILRSIRDKDDRHPTVQRISACLRVRTAADYAAVRDTFEQQNAEVREKEQVERIDRFLLSSRDVIRDRHAMVVLRLRDDHGHVVSDFDFLLTGKRGDPNKLPRGFFVDRQRNARDRGAVTYYVNYDVMAGSKIVWSEQAGKRRRVRDALEGVGQLGLRIAARPEKGLVHYLGAALSASGENLERLLRPDETTLVDIVLRRIVRQGAFRLTLDRTPRDFSGQGPGAILD